MEETKQTPFSKAQNMLAGALKIRWSGGMGPTYGNNTLRVTCADYDDVCICAEAAAELNVKKWRFQFLLNGTVAAEVVGDKWRDKE